MNGILRYQMALMFLIGLALVIGGAVTWQRSMVVFGAVVCLIGAAGVHGYSPNASAATRRRWR